MKGPSVHEEKHDDRGWMLHDGKEGTDIVGLQNGNFHCLFG